MAQTDLGKIVPASFERRSVDTYGQLSALSEFRIGGDIRILRIHVLHAGDAQRGGVIQGAFDGAQALLVRHGRNDFANVLLRRVFEDSGGIALRVAHDDAAGDIRRLGRDSGELHGQGVGQRHVSIMTVDENRRVRTDGVECVFRGELGRSPQSFIPIASQYPFPFWGFLYLRGDAFDEFLLGTRVAQLHLVKLRATVDKVHVGVVESGKQELACGIENLCLRPAPAVDFGAAAHGDNAVADHGHGFSRGMLLVDSPDLGVGDNHGGSSRGLGIKRRRRHEKEYIKKES